MAGTADLQKLQSLQVDDFFYFFLRLRKSRIRGVVKDLQERHPEESTEQLARRLIESFQSLSFAGGTLLDIPALLPGIGTALKAAGFVAGASALTRMHLYLILEVALLYGKDIDHEDRIPEMMAVVAATGAAAATPAVIQWLGVTPLVGMPLSGFAASMTARLIGEAAIRHYGHERLPASVGSELAPALA